MPKARIIITIPHFNKNHLHYGCFFTTIDTGFSYSSVVGVLHRCKAIAQHTTTACLFWGRPTWASSLNASSWWRKTPTTACRFLSNLQERTPATTVKFLFCLLDGRLLRTGQNNSSNKIISNSGFLNNLLSLALKHRL